MNLHSAVFSANNINLVLAAVEQLLKLSKFQPHAEFNKEKIVVDMMVKEIQKYLKDLNTEDVATEDELLFALQQINVAAATSAKEKLLFGANKDEAENDSQEYKIFLQETTEERGRHYRSIAAKSSATKRNEHREIFNDNVESFLLNRSRSDAHIFNKVDNAQERFNRM